MILGNLYRQKGQVGARDHRASGAAAAARPDRLEHAYVLLCLGLDFRHGGFIDRALEAFQEVVRLDPKNRYAFVNLQKLLRRSAAVGGRGSACGSRSRASTAATRPENQQILGFLRNQLGARRGAQRRHSGRGRDVSRRDRHRSADGAGLSEPRRHARRARGTDGRGRRGLGRAGPDRSPSVPTWRSNASSARTRTPARRSGSSSCASSSSTQSAGLAGASGAVAPLRRRPASIATRSICCSRRCPTTRTAWSSTRRSGRRCSRSASNADLVRRYVELTRERGLLPRSRTSARTAATEAPSCSGSARSATNGTRSSRSACAGQGHGCRRSWRRLGDSESR